jgi:hypothetical protein
VSVTAASDTGRLACEAGELVDLVGTEARPVIVVGDDDGSLEVAQFLDGGERLLIDRDIEDLVLETLVLECAVGCGALDAGGLCVDRDAPFGRKRWVGIL